ncbi:hypothetical protein JZ751_013448 [Albula glossodonta]|uniref:Pentraxin (PTX) domain-containing protein n=1 Tax=Albula glossodonta TaxID=121402 RepID=A0A8T2N3T7_9TELE|nr:hypothetical protein JZ751_013448 [Albula glossodonta]
MSLPLALLATCLLFCTGVHGYEDDDFQVNYDVSYYNEITEDERDAQLPLSPMVARVGGREPGAILSHPQTGGWESCQKNSKLTAPSRGHTEPFHRLARSAELLKFEGHLSVPHTAVFCIYTTGWGVVLGDIRTCTTLILHLLDPASPSFPLLPPLLPQCTISALSSSTVGPTLPPCQAQELSRWDKLFTMLEDSQMRQNMLLHSVDEGVRAELQALRSELRRVAPGDAPTCVAAADRLAAQVGGKLEQALERVEGAAARQEGALQQLQDASRHQAARMGKLEQACLGISKAGPAPHKQQDVTGGISLEKTLTAMATDLQRVQAQLDLSQRQAAHNFLPAEQDPAQRASPSAFGQNQAVNEYNNRFGWQGGPVTGKTRQESRTELRAEEGSKVAEVGASPWYSPADTQQRAHGGCEMALLFPQRSRRIYAAVNLDSPMALQAFTVCLWAKATKALNRTVLFSYGTRRNPQEVQLALSTSGGALFTVGGEAHLVKTQGVALDGHWGHYCGTWSSDQGLASLWVNGQREASSPGVAEGHSLPEGGTMVLGQEKNGFFDPMLAFAGKMTGLNVWDRVLVAEEISQHAQADGTSCSGRGNVVGWGISEIVPHGGAQYIN